VTQILRNSWLARAKCLCAEGLLLSIPAISVAQSVSISQYSLTSPDPRPEAITTGPDGALWFAEAKGGNIGRITTAGVITEYAVSTSGTLGGITTGPDGALWFTRNAGGPSAVGRITTGGVITEYGIPGLSFPNRIATGPDGALWFTDFGGPPNKIRRITTTGVITEYTISLTNGSGGLLGILGITTGPDGALWFTELWANRIGRITTAGVITEYAIPTPDGQPSEITTGPDGALWFTENTSNKIGRITTAGAITEYTLPTQDTRPIGITTGPDGALWFTEGGNNTNKVGRITTAGVITEYVVPTADNSKVNGIVAGPDGALWFTETAGNKIGRAGLSSGRLSMAQLASGGAWTTTITLVNTGAGAPAQAVLNFLDNDGSPLQLPLTFPQGSSSPLTASTFTGTVNAGGELVIQSAAPASQSTQVGWVQILTTGSISGFAVFTQAAGNSLQEAVIPLEIRTPGGFILSFDGTVNYATGVALANVADRSAKVGIVIRDDTGAVLLTDSIALPTLGHTSFVLATSYPITMQHRGTVEFDAPPNGQISVLGLRFNPTGAFSSIPAVAK
jgi:streptogramin lyase